MPQDAFTIGYVADELCELFTGGKISKIIQPQKDTLTLFIYTHKGTFKLDICLSATGCRMSVTKSAREAPQTAPNFCMLLRKYILGGEITDIKQVPFERIIFMDITRHTEFGTEKLRLYCELMGKYSNATLTKDGTILGALKTTSIGENTKRVLFSGAEYRLPEPQDKIPPNDMNAVERALADYSGDKTKFISDKIVGVAYQTAADITSLYGENPSATQICGYLCGKEKLPCVVYSNGKPVDFKARYCGGEVKECQSVLAAQTVYYDYVCEKREFEAAQRKLDGAVLAAVKKLEKRLAIIGQKLLDCRDMDELKLKGELITSNIYAIKRGMDKFTAVNYYDENGGTIDIALDKTLSPADNAQRYYKKYAKLKRTAAAVGEQKRETEERLEYLYSIHAHITSADEKEDIAEIYEELRADGILKDAAGGKKKKPVISPFRSYQKEGFKILAGRNNLQNDRLVKSLSSEDIWLHTKNYHSSHVAVLCEGKEVPESVLLAAAEICAYYSDGRGGGRIDVDYTKRKFVKKPKGANIGFVTYTDYKSLCVEPFRHEELIENSD